MVDETRMTMLGCSGAIGRKMTDIWCDANIAAPDVLGNARSKQPAAVTVWGAWHLMRVG